jgi:1-acyl-sn-glycerol-3-phosphate acyltransferase
MSTLVFVARCTALGVALLAAVLFSLRWLVQPLFRIVLRLRYRLIILGRDHIPRTGPVLIAANHVSWFDGFFVAAACPRRANGLVNATYVDLPLLRSWFRWIGLIPVTFSRPRAQRALFETCRKLLDRGEVLGLFPEGQISRTGLTGPFQRGLEVILAGRDDVAVIPCFIDNVWGSIFSFSGGRFFRKKPQGWRRTVIVAFGPPVPPPVTAWSLRQAVREVGVEAFEHREGSPRHLETIDPSLPHLDHPTLGPLTGSTPDVSLPGVRQSGHKPGTVGHPLPGVALRVVDDTGAVLGPDSPGRLLARVAGRPGWSDTQLRGSIDKDGFVWLVDKPPANSTSSDKLRGEVQD